MKWESTKTINSITDSDFSKYRPDIKRSNNSTVGRFHPFIGHEGP